MRLRRQHHDRPPRGVVLLEVVLAVALFFVTVTVLSAGLTQALAAAGRLRDQSMAADLAVTAQSELQMGLLELVAQGPDSLADEGPLSEWTREVLVEPVENIEGMLQVQVVITHTTTNRLTRLVSWMPGQTEPGEEELSGEETGTADLGGGP